MNGDIVHLLAANNDELPEGFHKVSVLLNEVEFTRIKRRAILTGEGTYSAAIRQNLGYPEQPWGLKSALRRAIAGRAP